MSEEKQIEYMGIITDLLIDFDEMGFAPTTTCPDPDAYAIEWREKITKALRGYRKASEVAREIFAEIEKSFIEYYDKTITYSSPTLPLHIREAAGFSLNEMFMKIAELKKKYTESEKDDGES